MSTSILLPVKDPVISPVTSPTTLPRSDPVTSPNNDPVTSPVMLPTIFVAVNVVVLGFQVNPVLYLTTLPSIDPDEADDDNIGLLIAVML